jgi:hypothetical protein
MSLPFDPSNLSVKKASAKLASLTIEELEAAPTEPDPEPTLSDPVQI